MLASYSVNGVQQSTYSYSGPRTTQSGLVGGVASNSFIYGADYTNVTNATGHTTRYEFTQVQGRPQLSRIVRNASANCPGGSSTLTYDTNGYLATETDFNGNRTEFTYDDHGHLLARSTGLVGQDTSNEYLTTFQWDDVQNLLLAEQHYGNDTSIQREVQYVYHPDTAAQALRRLPQSVTVCNGACSGGQQRTTTYSYTFHANNLVSTMTVTHPVTGPTTTSYDATGRVTAVTNAAGHTTSVSYAGLSGAMGLPTAMTDPNGLVTQIDYDARGRVTERRVLAEEGNRVTSVEYTPLDRISRLVDRGMATDFSYNNIGLLTQARRGLSTALNVMNFAYNALGQRTWQETRWSWLHYELQCSGFPEPTCTPVEYWKSEVRHTRTWSYDTAGFLASETGNYGQNPRWHYNQSGNLASFTDSLNGVTSYQYDSQQRIAQITNAAGGTVQFRYDALGRLDRVTDPLGQHTTYTYNGFGDLLSVTSPDTGTTTFTYDSAGRRLTMLASNGRSESYGYGGDPLGRVTSISANSPQLGAAVVTYTYDSCTHGLGRLCSVTSPGGTVGYAYRRAGEVYDQVSTINGQAYTQRHFYDGHGRLARIEHRVGSTVAHEVRYTYSTYHRVSRVEVKIGANNWQNVATSIGYRYYQDFSNSQLINLIHGNGLRRTLDRDLDGRVTRIRTDYGSTTRQNLGYGYNANDLITSRTNSVYGGNQFMGYDALARLTSVSLGSHTLVYDANGNREFHTWDYSGDTDTYHRAAGSNRVTGISTTGTSTRARSYTHDAAGNRLSETVAGNTIQYRYDGLNRLTERTQPTMSVQLSHGETVSLPAGTWQYSHDGLGRRTSKVQLDGQGAPIASTRVRYIYGPEGLLHAETTPGSTALGSVYIWLNGEPIGLIRNNTLYHVHSDHLGRPEVVTDASRNVVWRAAHYPWDRRVMTSSIGEYNLGFPGQYRDQESAQWYNYFRTYDGSIGRYTQADPIGLAGGMNTYLYANANPLTFVDPNGLRTSCPTRAQCISACLADRYGASYEIAWDLSPLSMTSIVGDVVSREVVIQMAEPIANRNAWGRGILFNGNPQAGTRQLRTITQFRAFNAVMGLAGAGALGYVAGANASCAWECR